MNLGIIGAGRFGRSFIQGILKSKAVTMSQLKVAERVPENLKMVQSWGVEAVSDFSDFIPQSDIIFIAVKPAQMKEVLEKLSALSLKKSVLLISVAAGVSTDRIQNLLTRPVAVIRAMPNSPCMIQQGVTALCRGIHADAKQLEQAMLLFQPVGKVLSVDEKYFDLVTALSGSGPAYFYLFMQVMIDVAVKGGLTHEQAVDLIAQTTKGAAGMVQDLKTSPEQLKSEVATPGGCTIEALKVLEEGEFPKLFTNALHEAARVAANLGKN